MTYYLVLLNRDVVVAVYSYDNEEAQLEMLDVLSKREFHSRQDPFYTHVQKHDEVN